METSLLTGKFSMEYCAIMNEFASDSLYLLEASWGMFSIVMVT